MNLLLWNLLNGWRLDSVRIDSRGMVWAGLTVRRPEGKFLPLGPWKDGPLLPEARDARP